MAHPIHRTPARAADGSEHQDRCDRCGRRMTARIASYFSDEMICMTCLAGEHALIRRLKARGVDVAALAGRGRYPESEEGLPPLPAAAGGP